MQKNRADGGTPRVMFKDRSRFEQGIRAKTALTRGALQTISFVFLCCECSVSRFRLFDEGAISEWPVPSPDAV